MTTTPLLTAGTETCPDDAVGQIDEPLLCTEVHQITHDVRSFVLESGAPRTFIFEAGQYLTVTVDVDGERLSRCYSISSPPTHPDRLTITVKRFAGGPVSNWLHDNLRPGSTLDVSGPFGMFTSARHSAPRQLYLTAGSGITPLMSMARTLVHHQSPADVVFVHHARTPADIIFRDELEHLGAAHPGVRVALVCEADATDERWTGHRGRISAALLDQVAPDVRQREVLICGPSAYRAAARDLVLASGVEPARVHEESYEFGGAGGRPATQTGSPAATHLVQFRRSQRLVECTAGSTILEAAALAGLTLPSSCQEGICGACKSDLLSGTVDMNHAGGIRPREIVQNKILLCCSTPTADLVIDA